MKLDIQHLPIAITGAGTGIGRASALACARAGMPVALAGRREEPLREVQAAIETAGGRAIVVSTDVADPDASARLIARTIEEFGTIYAVFANAGYGLRGSVHELSDDAIRKIFETNFFGSMHVIRPALAHMLEHRKNESHRGHILLCSSCLSKLGTPYTAPYSASKALQDHIGRGMRHELRPQGIHVSTVHPIGTRTEFLEAATKASGGTDTSLPPPEAFTQPPERIAQAVVACLRKPRGEVWTSHTVRLAFALATACPGLADWGIARTLRTRNTRKLIDADGQRTHPPSR